jgi:hypothetical protein
MTTERKLNKGCWVVKAADGTIYNESSEIKALRKAVSTAGTIEFVEWGKPLGSGKSPIQMAEEEKMDVVVDPDF